MTALARALVGVDAWAESPHAVGWLLQDMPGTAAAASSEAAAITEHRSQLSDIRGAIKQRLKRLARGREAARLAAAERSTQLRVPGLASSGREFSEAVQAAAAKTLYDLAIK